MATVEKIEKDIERAKAKISELQKKVKALEAQKKEAENAQIVNLVKAVKMDKETLTVFLKAYAKGDIELPEEYAKELEAAAALSEQEEETEDEE